MILLENLLLDIWSPDVLDLESRQFGKGFLKLSVSFWCISEKKKKTRIILRLSCVCACMCVCEGRRCLCMWRSEVDSRYIFFLNILRLLYWGRVFPLKTELAD